MRNIRPLSRLTNACLKTFYWFSDRHTGFFNGRLIDQGMVYTPRSNSFTLVLARVCASTFFTMTAQ